MTKEGGDKLENKAIGFNPYADLAKKAMAAKSAVVQNSATNQLAAAPQAYKNAGGALASARSSAGQGTETIYIDPNGDKQTGWIIDGKTYTDSGGTNSVGVGSQVQTGNGWYLKGENGSTQINTPNFGGNDGGNDGGSAYQPQATQPQGNNAQAVQGIINGVGQTVYLINGQSYLDKNGTQRVPIGSKVQTGNGWYELGQNGGVQTSAPQAVRQTATNPWTGETMDVWNVDGHTNAPEGWVVNTANGAYQMMGGSGKKLTPEQQYAMAAYGNMQKQQETAIRAAAEAGAQELGQQLPGINANYDGLAKQAYTNYALENKTMPEQMAKMGLDGQGIAETTAARLSGNYQTNLSNSEIARRTAIQQVNNDIANLIAGAKVDVAKSKLDIQQNYMNAYERLRAEAESKKQFELQYGDERADKQYNRQQAEIQKEEAKALAIGDASGNYSGLLKCGYSQMEVDALNKAWVRAQQEKAYSGRSGGGKYKEPKKEKQEKPKKMEYSQLVTQLNNSDHPMKTLNEIAATGISSADYEKLKEQAQYLESIPPYDRDKMAIDSGEIEYLDIRNNPEFADELRKKYGKDKYLELLKYAYAISGTNQ